MSMVSELSDRQLLGLYAAVMGEMRSRRLVRSSNGPGADYAEGLAAKAFALTLKGASTAAMMELIRMVGDSRSSVAA
jgi:hypothetical protein